MKRLYLILFIAALVTGIGLLFILPLPGYMDAEYYYAGGRQLYNGEGFSEFYIWNYLNPPESLPFPSHQYWMPMASLLAYLGMLTFQSSGLLAARIPFVLLMALVPPLTAAVTWACYRNTKTTILSGSLAVVSGFYLRFLTHTDTFAILMLCGLGLIYFLQKLANKMEWKYLAGIGGICGILYLSRAEGIIWLVLALIFLGIQIWQKNGTTKVITSILLVIAGYLVVAGPWLIHNLTSLGRLTPSGGLRGLWLTSYNDLFIFPPGSLNFSHWVKQGWAIIFLDRVKAAGINVLTVFGIHTMIILLPGILYGFWQTRKQAITKFFSIGYILLFVAMSVFFPYAGNRGGFLHACAFIQPFLWIMAANGILSITERLPQNRNFRFERFSLGIALISLIVSVFGIISTGQKSIAGINEDTKYIGNWILANTGEKTPVVMTNNAPGFFAVTSVPAVMIPVNGIQAIFKAADQYHANYLVIREELIPEINQIEKFWAGTDNLALVHEFTSSTGRKIFILKNILGNSK